MAVDELEDEKPDWSEPSDDDDADEVRDEGRKYGSSAGGAYEASLNWARKSLARICWQYASSSSCSGEASCPGMGMVGPMGVGGVTASRVPAAGASMGMARDLLGEVDDKDSTEG